MSVDLWKIQNELIAADETVTKSSGRMLNFGGGAAAATPVEEPPKTEVRSSLAMCACVARPRVCWMSLMFPLEKVQVVNVTRHKVCLPLCHGHSAQGHLRH